MFLFSSVKFHLVGFKDFIYLFLESGKGGRGRETSNIACPQLGTWSTTQACALTGNQISNLLVHRPKLNSRRAHLVGFLTYSMLT